MTHQRDNVTWHTRETTWHDRPEGQLDMTHLQQSCSGMSSVWWSAGRYRQTSCLHCCSTSHTAQWSLHEWVCKRMIGRNCRKSNQTIISTTTFSMLYCNRGLPHVKTFLHTHVHCYMIIITSKPCKHTSKPCKHTISSYKSFTWDIGKEQNTVEVHSLGGGTARTPMHNHVRDMAKDLVENVEVTCGPRKRCYNIY